MPSTPDHAEDVAARLDDERYLNELQKAFAGLRVADQEVLTSACGGRRAMLSKPVRPCRRLQGACLTMRRQ
jgi:hypothetical protein